MTTGPRAAAVLYAKDVGRLTSFYAEAFELAVVDRDDEHVHLESPRFQLVVRQIPLAIAADIRISTPPARRTDAAVKLVFFADDIERVRVVAEACGGVVEASAKSWTFQGWRAWDALDPEGNVIQIRAPAV